MSRNSHPPRIAPNEKYLQKRAERFSQPVPSLLVRIAGHAVLLPHDIALHMVRQRRTVVADLQTVPDITVTLSDIEADSDLEAMLLAA